MSTLLMKFLLIEYLLILLVCLWERNWPWALYWIGAATLTGALLVMKVRI